MIPIGSIGTPLFGPPPPELASRFEVIKACVLVMMASLAAKLLVGLVEGKVVYVLTASFNLIIEIVVGIFLLSYDEHLGPVYNFLVTTCCSQCREQCQGGMNCLLVFVIFNFVTVLFDVLLYNALSRISAGVQLLTKSVTWQDPSQGLACLLLVLSSMAALLAQTVGMYYGFKAFNEAQQGMSSVVGSNDSGFSGPTAPPWAGTGRRLDGETEMAARESQPGPGFQVFSGQGQRLGG